MRLMAGDAIQRAIRFLKAGTLVQVDRLMAGVPGLGPIGILARFAVTVPAKFVHRAGIQLRWIENRCLAATLFNMSRTRPMAALAPYAMLGWFNT